MSSSSPATARTSGSSRLGPPLDLVAPRIAHLISLQPFAAVSTSAVPLLSEITHHYLTLLVTVASRNASQAGRLQPNVWDMVAALADVGAGGIEELSSSSRSGWLSSENETRKDWQDRVETGWRDARARRQDEELRSAWKQHVRAGQTCDAEPAATLKFMRVRRGDLDDWEELRIRDEGRLPPKKRRKLRDGSAPTKVGSRASSVSSDRSSGDVPSDEEEGYFTDDLAAEEGSASTSNTPPPSLLPEDSILYKERHVTFDGSRRFRADEEDFDQPASYIPWFLPPLPGQQEETQSTLAERQAGSDLLQPTNAKREEQPPPDVKAPGSTAPGPASEGRQSLEEVRVVAQDTTAPAATVETIPDAMQSATGASSSSSYFSRPIPFSSSALFSGSIETNAESTESASDIAARVEAAAKSLPSIQNQETSSEGVRVHSTSSVPALISALTTLAASGETPAYLPMNNTPGGKIRRRLASLLCQPSRFDPSDVLYSSLEGRPSAIPFIPGPSHLVTLPPPGAPGGGAPRFTPTKPRGRPLSMGSIGGELGGASQPTLGYRRPRMAAEVARYLLAGAPVISQRSAILAAEAEGAGSNGDISAAALAAAAAAQSGEATIRPSTLHRTLHVYDPEPLRDEAHAERVFRGITLGGGGGRGGGSGGESDSLLRRGESCYKAAVDSLRISTGMADAAFAAAQASGNGSITNVASLSKAAQAGPASGTAVYTWDWPSRDFTEDAQ